MKLNKRQKYDGKDKRNEQKNERKDKRRGGRMKVRLNQTNVLI